ncbi:hypothetical protein IWQ60_012491 [Tieghemiomyces parasiticus]|uniref:4'-phosphopantetheinyl transferase domain-containing protein n=1 Tax=Tieghemiomyces parasiticus TaxID=78921 RepID=A0A9W8DLB4_9FUNG|nr:hypothetical protein IWQ60_012491 [Tieghemiomyces parasiticus]
MIVGIGVDLCRISRIRQVVTRQPGSFERFARRVLHPREWTDLQSTLPRGSYQSPIRTPSVRDGEFAQGVAGSTKTEADTTVEFIEHGSGVSEQAIRYLATRWAAKEAAYKALYPQRKLVWKEIAVIKPAGKSLGISEA